MFYLFNFNRHDSCSIQFLFINDLKSFITEEKVRDLIFDIIILKLGQRLDKSDDFYAKFLCQNKKIKKQVGLYEVESINNPNIITLAVNPKEYFEVFRTRKINKKHKGVKKTTPGMNFESFASRIMDIREYHHSEKVPKTNKQRRFQIRNTNMQMTTGSRMQFGLLNSKRFYLSNGVISLLYGHFLLTSIRENKKNINKYIKK